VGGGHYFLEGSSGGGGDGAAIFVFGGGVGSAYFDADFAVRSIDFDDLAFLDAALGGRDAEAQGGGFGEDQLR
jgi:hypothetical protein